MEALSLSAPEQAETRDPLGELARAAASGDLAAMRQLLDAVAPRLWRVVRGVLGPGAADVDDVAQESLIALVRALPAFRGECAIEGYAARIAVRTAVAAQQRKSGRERRLKDLPTEEELIEPAAVETYAAELRKELLRSLLAELPEAQAEALALRVVLGMKLDEVASATGAPLNTVRSRLRLAKQALKQRIEADAALAEKLEVPR